VLLIAILLVTKNLRGNLVTGQKKVQVLIMDNFGYDILFACVLHFVALFRFIDAFS